MPYTNQLTKELNCAIEKQDIQKIKTLLLEFDKETINKPNFFDSIEKKRPIDCAAEFGTAEIIELLVNCGADLNSINMQTGMAPLHIVVSQRLKTPADQKNCQAMLKMFIKLNADFNIKSKLKQQTPLHLVLVYNNVDYLLNVLMEIEKGKVDINAADVEGFTPLRYVLDKYGQNRPDLLELLYVLGGQTHGKGADEIASMLNTSHQLKHKSVIHHFLDFCEANNSDPHTVLGDNPLHNAVAQKNIEGVAKLSTKMRLDLCNANNQTPLDVAYQENCLPTLMAHPTIFEAIQRDLKSILNVVRPETKSMLLQNPTLAKQASYFVFPNKPNEVASLSTLFNPPSHIKQKKENSLNTSDIKLVESTIKSIFAGSNTLYATFIRQIKTRDNKAQLAADILEKCQQQENKPKNQAFYQQAVEELKTMEEVSTRYQCE